MLDSPRTARQALLTAGAIALAVALLLAGVATRQWWHVRGWPAESARAERMVPTGHLQHCGKFNNEDVYEITWVSKNPPEGLPATFTSQEGCDAPQVGDVVTVVRVVNDDGSVHVWDDPTTSGRDVAIVLAASFGGMFALAWLTLMARIWWRRWRGHDDRLGHAATAPGDGKHAAGRGPASR